MNIFPSDVSTDFLGRPTSAVGGLWCHVMVGPGNKAPEVNAFCFSKILPKFEFEVKFSMKLYTSLTHEDPTYLQITYHYVHYFKYTELESFFQQQVWAPKLVYWLLNHPGYIYVS